MIVAVGIDLVDVARISAALDRHGERFLARCFAPGELLRPADPSHVAGLFAAKEAAFKALGTGWGEGVGWHDVTLSHSAAGAPQVELHGQAGKRAAALGAVHSLVSITHTSSAAAAVVILQR